MVIIDSLDQLTFTCTYFTDRSRSERGCESDCFSTLLHIWNVKKADSQWLCLIGSPFAIVLLGVIVVAVEVTISKLSSFVLAMDEDVGIKYVSSPLPPSNIRSTNINMVVNISPLMIWAMVKLYWQKQWEWDSEYKGYRSNCWKWVNM